MRGRRHWEGFLAALALGSGCAASGSFDGSVFRDKDVAYQVSPVPAGWHRVEVQGANLAFRDEAHEASILVNSRCASDDRDAPLTSLTEHLIIGTTDRAIASEETIPFDGREARHSVLRAKLDGVPMTYDIFVLKKDGCVFDLVFVAPPARADAGMPGFDRFVRGFHTLSSGG
jgi:hypothetical protein